MKDEIRITRDAIAHDRSIAALTALLGEDNEHIQQLRDLRAQRMPADVASMYEREIMAEIHEGMLAAKNAQVPVEEKEPAAGLDADVSVLLAEHGYDSPKAVREAPDEDLLAIKGIGPRKLVEIRESVG